MADTTTTVKFSFPILSLTGLLFVALKLTHQINWSWWWVTLPFWGLPSVLLGFAAVFFLVWCVLKLGCAFIDWRSNRRRRQK